MSTPRPTISRISGLSRLVILLTVLAVGANAFYTTTSSKKSSSDGLPEVAKTDPAIKAVGGKQSLLAKINEELSPANTSLSAFMPQEEVLPRSVATYDGTCTTPKSAFELGDTVCVKTTGFNVTSPAQVSVTLSDPASEVLDRTDLENSANVTFTLPTNGVTVTNGIPVDNRGTWGVKVVPVGRYIVRANAVFTVTDPANKAADVSVYNLNQAPGNEAQAGANTTFELHVVNNGPDDAQNVSVTHSVLANATFVSQNQDVSLPLFTCTNPSFGSAGTSTCTIATMPKGSRSVLRFVYDVDAGATRGTVVTATTQGTSGTTDLDANNDSWTARAIVSGAAPEDSCSIGCSPDLTVTANATNANNEPGAIVNFANEQSGSCGTITSSPASGSFFPVGTTQVTVTSSEGGGSCTFSVTVLGTAAPTIDCPDDVTATAADGACEATVNNLGTPTTNPAGLEVTAVRSDGQPLDAPYPGGETIVTWTATDSDGRTASCPQKVTVTVNDTTPPTVEAPADVNVATPPGTSGSCGLVIGETALGTPEASDNCTVTVIRTGVPAGNFFPVGTTTITYQARDGAGNLSQPDYQTITVTDGTPPLIEAPADATYTCMSDVPEGDPSQATNGGGVDSNGDPIPPGPPSDNCSAVTVTVSDSSTGAGSASDPRIITRTFTATDVAGNSASDEQIITVVDSTAPTVSAPGDVVLNTGAGATSCGITISDLDAALGAGSASDNCSGATVVRSGVPAGNTFPVGETTISYTAVDAAGNSSDPVTQKVTVVDNTAPTVSAPADVTLYTGPGATSCSVTVANLDTTLGTATASDNCTGVTVARGNVPAGNAFPLGETLVSYTATDAHGNSSAPVTQKVTVVDNTPPVVTPPANITVQLPLNSPATSMVVNYPNPATATDNCAGTITFNYSPASGSVFNVGPTTVTVTATDAHGNSASATFTVTVLYNFTGFFQPVDNLPTLNSVNAGRAIPVKFSLSGNKGLGIMAAGSPYTVGLDCGNGASVDVEETLTAGGSSLSYGSGDQYIYVWKTESSWAGTCRQLVVKLNDGSEHRANFKFK
jgi:Domain of unknown function DUF11/HYR domain